MAVPVSVVVHLRPDQLRSGAGGGPVSGVRQVVDPGPLGRHEPDATPADWQVQAACAGMDPDIFFPERGKNARAATKVCFRCPVREECLAYALERGEKFGVWGGTTERERRALRRRMAVS